MHLVPSASHSSAPSKERTHSRLHAALAALASGTLWPSGVLGAAAFAAAVWLAATGQGGPAAVRWQPAELTAPAVSEAETPEALAASEASAAGAASEQETAAEAAASPELVDGWEEKAGKAEEEAEQSAHELASAASAAEVAAYISRSYRVPMADARQLTSWALEIGAGFDVDPLLLLAIAGTESSFNPKAKNGAGAEGLMQIMTRVHKEKFAAFGGASAALEPYPNMVVGASILSGLISRTGSVQTALKWYYGAANKSSDNGYGAKVLRERSRLQVAASGDSQRAVELSRKGASGPSPAAGRVKNLGFGEWHTMVAAHAEKRGTAKLLSAEPQKAQTPEPRAEAAAEPSPAAEAAAAESRAKASGTSEASEASAASEKGETAKAAAAAKPAETAEALQPAKADAPAELPEALSSEVDLTVRPAGIAKAAEAAVQN